jgi:hypothetical protein
MEQCYANPALYLMADERLVETAEGARFSVCPMRKHPEPVLRPTTRWEGGDGTKARPVQQDPVDGSILYEAEEKRFHLWYRTHNNLAFDGSRGSASRVHTLGSRVAYATSCDGFAWERPRVGLVPFEGSLDNNLIAIAVPPVLSNHLSGVTVNRVPGLGCALVATVFSDYDDPVYPHGITFLTSSDGLRWSPHFPPPLPLDGDAHCLSWDPHADCYVCTTRSYVLPHLAARLRARGCDHLRAKRHVAVARSRDLVHWTPMLPVLEADDQDAENAELYYLYVLPYGHGYVGLLQVFMTSPNLSRGTLEMQLAFSRDLLHWQRVGRREPILPRGSAGCWDQAHVSLCTSPPHPEGNELRFWYGGKDAEHYQRGNAALGTATLRRDGFACWEAGTGGGTLTTVALDLAWGTSMFLNADASKGEIVVEVLDARTMAPVAGTARQDARPVHGDGVDLPVVFAADRGSFLRHVGPVRFRFHLRDARLYAFSAPNCTFAGTGVRPASLW